MGRGEKYFLTLHPNKFGQTVSTAFIPSLKKKQQTLRVQHTIKLLTVQSEAQPLTTKPQAYPWLNTGGLRSATVH